MLALLLPRLGSLVPKTVGRLGLRPPNLPPAIVRRIPRLIDPLASLPGVRSPLNRFVINFFGYATPPRPRPLTLLSDYTSWRSLTDRTFTGRHLPPAPPEQLEKLPSEADVVGLFRREQMTPSTDTSVLFMFFAQWFTDSFLRTSRDDFRRNTSNHEIDLCQIYGLSDDKTRLLRSMTGGRLKSQQIDGVEYPVFLFEPRPTGGPLIVKPEFAGLHDEAFLIQVLLDGASDEHKDTFFAVGLEHGNATIGQTMMNSTFLREHNRIAHILQQRKPEWDDDRLFETTRNIMIVLILKLVVEEYIKHIAPFDFPVEMVPFIADGESWNRSNWCAIEFNLLYRWHSLAPDTIGSGPEQLHPGDFINNNPLVLSQGTEPLMARCSLERAGKIGLRNTPTFLVDRSQPDHPSVEERTVSLGRLARLRSYNDYREAYGLNRFGSWRELTADIDLRQRLEDMYDDIDMLEWYVGIFAEDYPDYFMMGELLTTMVANDAFTQALTNPLLSRQVYSEATFSADGLRIIEETKSLSQIVARNSRTPEDVLVEFSCLARVGAEEPV